MVLLRNLLHQTKKKITPGHFSLSLKFLTPTLNLVKSQILSNSTFLKGTLMVRQDRERNKVASRKYQQYYLQGEVLMLIQPFVNVISIIYFCNSCPRLHSVKFIEQLLSSLSKNYFVQILLETLAFLVFRFMKINPIKHHRFVKSKYQKYEIKMTSDHTKSKLESTWMIGTLVISFVYNAWKLISSITQAQP